MLVFPRACLGPSLLAATLAAIPPAARAQSIHAGPPDPHADASPSPLMLALDRAAAKSADPAHARLQLLARLQLSNACYPNDLTPQQLDDLIARTQLLPPTVRPLGPRFYTDTTCWLGAGSTIDPATSSPAQTGTSRPAQLTYSFPDDGVHWGLTCAGYLQGPNDLGAKLIAAYGSLDRGREFIRSSLGAWRSVAGLTYTEVPDDNSSEDTSSVHVSTRGDIRIGGLGFAPIGNPLAYNAFPGAGTSSCSGGDMTINTNYFTPVYFTNTIGNYLYFRNTVAHEHGHGLGFLHTVPCNQTKLMEPNISNGVVLLSPDDVRAAIRNYGDRYSPLNNHFAANAKDFGNLTSPSVRSVIERDLGLNGTAVILNTTPPTPLFEDDWFKFTLSSTQSVTITVDPTGYSPSGACCVASVCSQTTPVRCSGNFVLGGVCQPTLCGPATMPTTCTGANNDPNWCQGQQGGACSGAITTIDAQKAGNLALELRASDGAAVLAASDSPTLGVSESIAQPTLAPGTYYVRVWDSGGSASNNQTVQTYDMTIRVGASHAPPVAIASTNVKRVPADQPCSFVGNHNSYATESAATLPAANFAWDFDGDLVYDSAGSGQPQPTFTYRSNGTFNVTLRVTDTNGFSAIDTIQVVVTGATTSVTSVSPNNAVQGVTQPVTIIGTNLKGVTSASQVSVSGGGITVTGTPVPNLLGTRLTGLSFVLAPAAAPGDRDVTITNSDGMGSTGGGAMVFTVNPGTTTGACCAANGTCSLTDAASCPAAYQGPGTICSPNPCPLPTGACCFGSTCTATTQAACIGPNHAFTAVGLACNPAGNFATPCCKPNFNQNGTLEVQDIFDFLNGWFNLDPATDINGNGVNVQDIFDFLNAWFAGC